MHFSCGLVPEMSRYWHLVLLCLALIEIRPIENVDRNNFKTCEQSSFCRSVRFLFFHFESFAPSFLRRQRKYKPDQSPYEVDFGSMKTVGKGHLQFRLVNTLKTHVKLQLDLFTLEENSLRMKINEVDPIRKRYEVEHVLVSEPKLVE